MTTSSNDLDVRKGRMRLVPTFYILRTILYALSWLLAGMRVRGSRNVPRNDGCIIVANHLHNLDPLLISIACPRPLHYMAKVELMKVPVLGKLLAWAGAFPIHRGKVDRTALRHAQAVVEQDVALGIFPEGTRSKDMKITRVLPGAGMIALQNHAAIVPCAIVGTERLPFNGNKQARSKLGMPKRERRGVTITFGEPFTIERDMNGARVSPADATDIMMRRVAELLPPDYRGIYGHSSSSSSSSSSSEI